MPPAPPAATRLPALACALAAAAALSFSACGEGATAEGPENATSSGTSTAKQGSAKAPTQACPGQVDALLDDLDRLRRQLAVGLSYDQYSARVEQLRVAYAEIPVDRLGLACLRTAGTPAERALNGYIDGANAWGECLADAGCTTATVEPVLQRKWRDASRFLARAG